MKSAKSMRRRAGNHASAINRWRMRAFASLAGAVLSTVTKELQIFEDDDLTENIAGRLGSKVREASVYLDLEVDEVTKLPGRRNLVRHANELIKSGGDFALLYIDFNGFKTINDKHSYWHGDKVLEEIGGRLRSGVSLARRGDYVARVGGDEFVVLWANPGAETNAIEASIRLWRDVCLEPVEVGNKTFRVRFSGGVVWLSAEKLRLAGPDILTFMLERSEFAMKEIKAKRYDDDQPQVDRYYKLHWQERMKHRQKRERLQDAVDNGLLDVHFQPIVGLEDCSVCGFEAFPDHAGLVEPEISRRSFLEIIHEMESDNATHLMWRKILEESVKFLAMTDPGGSLCVSTNVTADQVASPGFTQLPIDLCRQYGVNPSQITFEVVERKKLSWNTNVALGLSAIRREGFSLALDDFGQGENTPATLNRFAHSFTAVKLDAHFVRSLKKQSRPHREVLTALTNMVAAWGLPMTAEGIESPDILPSLRALGVHSGQGFLWGDKLTADEASKYYKKHRRPT